MAKRTATGAIKSTHIKQEHEFEQFEALEDYHDDLLDPNQPPPSPEGDPLAGTLGTLIEKLSGIETLLHTIISRGGLRKRLPSSHPTTSDGGGDGCGADGGSDDEDVMEVAIHFPIDSLEALNQVEDPELATVVQTHIEALLNENNNNLGEVFSQICGDQLASISWDKGARPLRTFKLFSVAFRNALSGRLDFETEMRKHLQRARERLQTAAVG